MKKNKILFKIVEQALKEVFINGKMDQKKAEKYIKVFKALPIYQSIYCLSIFLKGIKKELAKKTIIIESVMQLSENEKQSIVKKVQKDYQVESHSLKLNDALIGGIKVQIGDFVYDCTVENKINQLARIIKG